MSRAAIEERVEGLRRVLASSTDLTLVYEYVQEHLGSDGELLYKSTETHHVVARELALRAFAGILRPGAQPVEVICLRLEGSDLVHGVLSSGTSQAIYLWFERDLQGYVAMGGLTGPSRFARLTAAEVEEGAYTIPRPGGAPS